MPDIWLVGGGGGAVSVFSENNTSSFYLSLLQMVSSVFSENNTTVNPLYNDNVCSMLSLTLKSCCYKEILTSTKFQHHNHLVKRNIIQMN